MSNDDPVMMPEEKYWWFSHTEYPAEINDFLKTLIELGMIEGAALGISRLVIDQGTESLTVKQAAVFDRHVIRPHAIQRCPISMDEMRWSEMLHHDGLCARCHYKSERND